MDLTAKYLRRPGLARLAFIATRKPPSPEAVEVARDIFRVDNKLLIFLADTELSQLAQLGGRGTEAEAYLRRVYQGQKMVL
ncbi:MAG: hypothetical protein IPI67_24455 [Myxococcales bacterium]|nr:hypothetical protein [Myxococcales bacterium]